MSRIGASVAWRSALIRGGVLAAICLIYFFFDPAAAAWMPKCPLHELTGLECPGCGTQRALHALLHGHIADAFSYNALLIISLPLIAWMVWLETQRMRRPALYAAFYRPLTIYIIAAVIVAWFVVRNFLISSPTA